jgi:hypothetical protein
MPLRVRNFQHSLSNVNAAADEYLLSQPTQRFQNFKALRRTLGGRRRGDRIGNFALSMSLRAFHTVVFVDNIVYEFDFVPIDVICVILTVTCTRELHISFENFLQYTFEMRHQRRMITIYASSADQLGLQLQQICLHALKAGGVFAALLV